MRSIATNPDECRAALGITGAEMVIGLIADFRAATFFGEVPEIPISASVDGEDHLVCWALPEGIELHTRALGMASSGMDGWKAAYRVRLEHVYLDGGIIG